MLASWMLNDSVHYRPLDLHDHQCDLVLWLGNIVVSREY